MLGIIIIFKQPENVTSVAFEAAFYSFFQGINPVFNSVYNIIRTSAGGKVFISLDDMLYFMEKCSFSCFWSKPDAEPIDDSG